MPTFSPAGREVFFRTATLAALALAAALAAGTARAETGVGMLLAPWDWDGKQTASLSAWAGKSTATNRTTGEETRLRYSELQGRFHGEGMPFMVGWQGKFMGFGSTDRAAIPQMLHDTAFSLATSLTPKEPAQAFGKDWDIGLEAGAGQAASSFGDSRGYYGTATLTAGTDLSDTARLVLAAAFDGNRAVWQDIPLAGVEYRDSTGEYLNGDKRKPVFSWRVGFPRAGVEWRPDDRWLVAIQADIASLGAARVEYELGDTRWRLFGALRPYRIRAHQEGDDDRHRLFFSSETVEFGARFSPRAGIHLLGAAGYSFNQVLERGWDARNLSTVREFDAAPMIRGEVRWDF